MKKRVKAVVARTAGELAKVLGLERSDGIEERDNEFETVSVRV